MYNPGGKGSVLSMFTQALTDGFYPRAARLPGGSEGKECTCNADDLGLIPGLGRPPWRRQQLQIPVYSRLENPPGQRSLMGYSP